MCFYGALQCGDSCSAKRIADSDGIRFIHGAQIVKGVVSAARSQGRSQCGAGLRPGFHARFEGILRASDNRRSGN